jgi:hypothetical protein
LIGTARGLYAEELFGVDLAQTVYALAAMTIDLYFSVSPYSYPEGLQATHLPNQPIRIEVSEHRRVAGNAA